MSQLRRRSRVLPPPPLFGGANREALLPLADTDALSRSRLFRAALVAASVLTAACANDGISGLQPPGDASLLEAETESFEVWLVDQSNTGAGYGGAIYVYEGSDLMGEDASAAAPLARVDLAGATAALCLSSTGANPVRPHMLFFNSTHSHAVLAFVASGHVVVFDAASRTPVSCIRTSPGAGGARQAHAAVPSPDDAFIVVANQNGKQLERIDADYASNTFTLNPVATLDLANGTTPSGAPRQSLELRPDNAPICPLVDASGALTFVTLRGGGLFVVDARQTPMQIIAEYDRTNVDGNGCGGTQAGANMYVNSGGGTASNLHTSKLYRFPLSGYSASNGPNLPAPTEIFSASGERDAHGTVATRNGRFLWMLDRAANLADVFSVATGARVNTVHLAGGVSADPTPDLADVSPSGNRLFVSLRGPNPLSGDPHVASGTTPGLGVVNLSRQGQAGSLKSVVRISNVDAGGVERADAHGIRVRIRR